MTVAAIFHRQPNGPDADRELLRRFADRRDDGAFAALVHRYGRLVFATCLRVLSHRADAEDAYQATFLVLARRCGAIRSDEKLAGWLHTVAVRTATEVRRMRDRRRQAEATPSLTLPAPTDPLESRELAAVLDEELAKLPDHYRLAVVLCELNGVGRKAAAKELGVAEGTLSSRLAKARKLLADRLTSRGFGAVSAGVLTAALASSAVARIPAAALAFGRVDGIINITIQSVADTVVKAMFATKLKAGALVAVLLALAGGVVWTTAAGAGPGDGPAPAKEKPDPAAELVAQLGGKDFADREAAEKALKEMGAAAFAAVTAGLKSDNPEIVRRCQKLMPVLRAAHLARPESEVWKRFAAITGDTAHAKELFLEMVSDPARADALTDGKPATHYPAAIERSLKAYELGIEEAWEQKRQRVREQTGRTDIEPLGRVISTKLPTRGTATLLFFLGSFAETAAAKPTIGKDGHRLYAELLRWSLDAAWKGEKEGFPPETRKLFAAWLGNRADAEAVRIGMALARTHEFAEALSVARALLADKKRSPLDRAPALHVVALLGTKDDIPLVRPFLDSETVFFHSPDYDEALKRRCTVQVRDVAHAVAAKLLGAEPMDLGFDFCERHKTRGAKSFKDDYMLGFSTDEKRKAAHAKVKALLEDEPEQPNQDDPAAELVAQLGSKDFAEREAAQKALKEMGAAAFAAVTAGLKSDNPEIVRRCQKLMPVLRAAHLARPESEVWKRFVAITGDTPHAKELFLDMAADLTRADILTADKPAEQYAELVKRSMAALRKGYDEAERTAGGRTGIVVPTSGTPTRPDGTLLYFLGTAADTATVKPDIAENDRWLYSNMLGQALCGGKEGDTLAAETRKLFAAWLAVRRDAVTIRRGFQFARLDEIAEALPVARSVLANDRLTLAERTPALFVVALAGTKADLDLVRPFLESDIDSVYHATNYTTEDRKQFPVATRVSDAAHAVAGKLLGGEPIDLGFEFCELYKARGAAAFKDDYKLGFMTEAKRTAAHANVKALLAKAPAPKDLGPPARPKLPKAAPPSADLRAALAGPSVICTAKMVGELEARAAELAKKFPAAEDQARVFLHTAEAITNGRLKEDAAKVKAFAEKVLEVSRDPVTRWKVRILIAPVTFLSEIEDGGGNFAKVRRVTAEVLLAGYVELLAQDLPDIEPELPGVGKFDEGGPVGNERRAEQIVAREEAKFTKEQVAGRTLMVTQLRDLYKPAPNDPHRTADGVDELRALAAKKMTEREVSTLTERVLEGK